MRCILLLSALALPVATLYSQVAVTWTSLGPHHINGRNASIQSGKLQALAIFPGDSRVMYAGGGLGSGSEGPPAQAGVFKTTDGGVTWTAINHGLTDSLINALWVDSSNQNLVLAGTELDGIFRSTDGGGNWTRIGTYAPASDFLMVNGSLLAAVSTGIVSSTDGGATWSPLLSSPAPARTLSAGGGSVIAGLENGTVMLQTRAGVAFQQVMQTPGRPVWSVAIDPDAPENAFAVLGQGSTQATPVLTATSDAGRTWTTVNVGMQPQALVFAPAIKTIFLGASDGLWASTDGGRNWRVNTAGRWDTRRVYWNDAQRILYLGTDQGLHRSTDSGANFSGLSGAVRNSILTGLAVRGSTILAGVHDFDPILSFDGGDTWTQPSYLGNGLPVGEDGPVVLSGNYCYAATNGGFQYSTNGCKTFQMTSAPGLRGRTLVMPGGVNAIAAAPSDPTNVYVGTTAGVFRSTDSGVTMLPTPWPMTQVTAIAVHPADAKTILVASTSGLSRTTDGGGTWSPVAIPTAGYPTTIAFHPVDPRMVLIGLSLGAARGGGVLRSTDSGVTFRVSNTGLPTSVRLPPCCNWDVLSVRFSQDGLAALATRTGLFLSLDQGQSWQSITANSVGTYFADVAWDGGFLYAATYGGGVLRAPLGATTLSATPTSLTFAAGGAPQSVGVTSSPGAATFSALATTETGGSWLSVSPAAGTTPASVSVAVNAAGLAAGAYTGKITIASPAASAAITIPVRLTVAAASTVVVTDVVNGASYQPGIAPNAWVTIRGTGLSPTTRSWGADDFQDGKLPVALDGVGVSINGQPAYVYYISPTQLNVLAPANPGRGSVPVIVRAASAGSVPVNATVADVSPAFFLIAPETPAATHADGSLIGPVSLFPGATQPAHVGETIVLYGTGFGATTPTTPAGIVGIATAPLANPVLVRIGGATATVIFAGIISPGLYQLNVVVPDVAEGAAVLTAEIGGVRSPDVQLAVQR